jgi:hypothetical protein
MKNSLKMIIAFESGGFEEQNEIISFIDKTIKEFKTIERTLSFLIDFKKAEVVSSKLLGAIGKASTEEIVNRIELLNVQPQIKNSAARFGFDQNHEKILILEMFRGDQGVQVVEVE